VSGARGVAPAAPRPWRRLHVRIATLALALFGCLGVTMVWLVQRHAADAQAEATQRVNLELARYVVAHQNAALIAADGTPNRALMRELATHVMAINPAVEVYLLGADGRVLGHAIDGIDSVDPIGTQVDLGSVRALLADGVRLPVYGADPRQPGRRDVVSVAALASERGTPQGYVYIVLNGAMQQAVNTRVAESHSLHDTAFWLLLATLAAALMMVLALRHLTRPLRTLAAELAEIQRDDQAAPRARADDEIAVLRAAVSDLRRRVADQMQRLQQADRQRRELIGNISHDLRTPLASIRGYVETVLVRDEQLDVAARAQHLRTALRHLSSLDRRIAELFELSKLDAGRVTPRVESFHVAELLQDVVQNYQLTAQERGVRLDFAAATHAHLRVAADIALIERVLQNLIDNALRYTPAGGAVTVALAVDDGQIEVSVSDNGRGIAREHLPHIFERYWRPADADDMHAGHSSGLGLAIVKRILELHGSVARVQSERTRGTRVAFALPAA
jgi:signal transduction histidine kinase